MSNDKPTILYVDDEEINLFLFESSFDKFNVITAESGKEGLHKLEEFKEISVIISDMKMPKMNGLEFVSKAQEKFKNKKYFMLTGFNDPQDIDADLESYCITKFFSKPYDIEEIEKTIFKEIQ